MHKAGGGISYEIPSHRYFFHLVVMIIDNEYNQKCEKIKKIVANLIEKVYNKNTNEFVLVSVRPKTRTNRRERTGLYTFNMD